jgi:hypothetical protein
MMSWCLDKSDPHECISMGYYIQIGYAFISQTDMDDIHVQLKDYIRKEQNKKIEII